MGSALAAEHNLVQTEPVIAHCRHLPEARLRIPGVHLHPRNDRPAQIHHPTHSHIENCTAARLTYRGLCGTSLRPSMDHQSTPLQPA